MCEEYEQQLERVQGQLTLELEDKEKETIKLKGDHDKISVSMDGWMDGWMDGRTDGRMDGWMMSGWVV